jgi:hypothetical protein
MRSSKFRVVREALANQLIVIREIEDRIGSLSTSQRYG